MTAPKSPSRPLTGEELRDILIVLADAIGRDGARLIKPEQNLIAIYERLRTAARALDTVADHACNNWSPEAQATA